MRDDGAPRRAAYAAAQIAAAERRRAGGSSPDAIAIRAGVGQPGADWTPAEQRADRPGIRAARSPQDAPEAAAAPTGRPSRATRQATPAAPPRPAPAEADRSAADAGGGAKTQGAHRPAARGEMSAEQFRQALDAIGISQVGFARLIGISGRTVRAWTQIEGGLPVPRYAAAIVLLLGRWRVSPDKLATMLDELPRD